MISRTQHNQLHCIPHELPLLLLFYDFLGNNEVRKQLLLPPFFHQSHPFSIL